MNEDFKKWLHENAYKKKPHIPVDIIDIELLIKAMWNINKKWINKLNHGFVIKQNDMLTAYVVGSDFEGIQEYEYFWFYDYNNSEEETLTAALKYIFDN